MAAAPSGKRALGRDTRAPLHSASRGSPRCLSEALLRPRGLEALAVRAVKARAGPSLGSCSGVPSTTVRVGRRRQLRGVGSRGRCLNTDARGCRYTVLARGWRVRAAPSHKHPPGSA